MKPLNNGQVGAKGLVHYSEVVLYWEVFIKKRVQPYVYVTSLVHSRLVDILDAFTSLTAPSILGERRPSLRTEIVQFF